LYSVQGELIKGIQRENDDDNDDDNDNDVAKKNKKTHKIREELGLILLSHFSFGKNEINDAENRLL
jgi:hypothetical protein